MSESAAATGQWVQGRNGGRLRVGGVARGPNKSTTAVRHGITAALRDPRGGSGKDFWLKLKCGSAEDKRVFANIVARLIPVEVQGDLNESLTVVIKTLVRDEPEMNIPLNGVCTVGEATDRTRIGARDEAETTAPDATP